MSNLNEDNLTEQPVIAWLRELGYEYEYGPDLAPGGSLQERESFKQVLLVPRLKRSLKRLNPDLTDAQVEEVVRVLTMASHPNLEIVNKQVFELLSHGIVINVRDERGQERGKIVRVFDFENPTNNELMAVNQYAIQGIDVVRRPDVVVFINGIPVAIFELKSPTSESGTIISAYGQLQQYKQDIPEIFKYNQLLIVSDLLQARHGTISSSWEWFSAWKGIESESEKHEGVSELEVLIKGIFHKTRLLDIIQNFIVFEADSEKDATKYTKKMCMYHQYYGVNKAVVETLRAVGPKGNKKIGVFWHTQGSGKSLSMVFYINKTKQLEALASPTYVFLTDRNDLDGQLYKVFLRSGYPQAKQAETISDLKDRLRQAAGELIFTTIQKFETEKELLSENENIIVISDEAHRSQYAKLAGNVRESLPNASFMGITGTPVSLHNRSTELVFGGYISQYQINRAVEDGATVPIYYEGRLVPLHLTNEFIDEEYEDLMAEHELEVKETFKRKWTRLEQAVGAQDRLEQISQDIIKHYNDRGLEGKAMVVTISRRVAVELYKLISQIPGAPETAVIISNAQEFQGQIQSELDSKDLEKRFKNPNDHLKLVIVCDMWLTGFDVPCLHTMYLDKPLKNHTLMQAIARVNRIFKDKPAGLIVDYIGIADNLKKALSIYSGDIQKQAMVPIEEIAAKMQEKYDIVCSMLSGNDFNGWRKLDHLALAQLFQKTVDRVVTDQKTGLIDEEQKKRFIQEAESFSRLFGFVMPHPQANAIRDEVEFIRAIKRSVAKLMAGDSGGMVPFDDLAVESAVRELVSQSIAAEGVIDVLAMRGKGAPDISIFDDKFLEEVKNMRMKNLAIETLRKLLRDQLRVQTRKNLVRYQSFAELLEKIIEDYENNIINSSKVIERLIELAKEIRNAEKQGVDLGLSEEELAFFDAISTSTKTELKNGELKDLVKDLVKMIKRDLGVDWTNNEVIKSRIRANVRLLLLRNQVSAEESEKLTDFIFNQAFALYRDYVPA